MRPEFTSDDIAEAQRLNAKLNWLPRFRMQTALGRIALNIFLQALELYPLMKGNQTKARKETRTIDWSGRRVKVRIFHPPAGCRGVILDFHGGGWTVGNARMTDGPNAKLAVKTGAAVVSVDYRLALTGLISTSVDDCEAAALWLQHNIRDEFGAERIAIKASSAGAHLATLTLLRLRDGHNLSDQFVGAVLFFGLYDFSATPMVRAAGSECLILHGPTVRSTLVKLTPDRTDEERKDPSISPLYADLRSLPPALFLVGAEDMLLQDNQLMEARWRSANGNAELIIVPASPHAFDRLNTSIAKKVEAYASKWITDRLSHS